MFDWLKKLFSPKTLIKAAIDSLDFAVPYMAAEIDKHPEFNALNSTGKAQVVIDKIQDYLRKKSGIDQPIV